MTNWHGTNPYCLVITKQDGSNILIDLDEPGWATTHAEWMRVESQWILARKSDSTPVLTLIVEDGEQPYYTTKVHTTFLPPPEFFQRSEIVINPEEIKEMAQIRSYGIGKKLVDGHVDRLWVLPNGMVCGGDDIEVIGASITKQRYANIITELRNIDGRHREEGQGGSQEGRGSQGQAAQG